LLLLVFYSSIPSANDLIGAYSQVVNVEDLKHFY